MLLLCSAVHRKSSLLNKPEVLDFLNMNQKHVELFNVVLPDLDSHAFSYCSSLPHHKSLLAASCYTSFFGSCHPSVMSMFVCLLLLMDGVFPSNDDTTLCATVNVTSRIQTQSHSSSRLTGCPNNHVKTYGDRDGNPLLDNGTPLPMENCCVNRWYAILTTRLLQDKQSRAS